MKTPFDLTDELGPAKLIHVHEPQRNEALLADLQQRVDAYRAEAGA